MLKKSVIILLVLLIWLQYRLWVGYGSLQEQGDLSREIAARESENARLRARNEMLRAEVADLKQGLGAIEERARMELGMVKKGENFYQIIEDDDKTQKLD